MWNTLPYYVTPFTIIIKWHYYVRPFTLLCETLYLLCETLYPIM